MIFDQTVVNSSDGKPRYFKQVLVTKYTARYMPLADIQHTMTALQLNNPTTDNPAGWMLLIFNSSWVQVRIAFINEADAMSFYYPHPDTTWFYNRSASNGLNS